MSEFGKDTTVSSRKGVFIPGISVEMFRNASLECVEDLLACGAMEDISLPSAQPEIVRCKDCKWKQGSECVRFAEVRPFANDFCSRAERRTDE